MTDQVRAAIVGTGAIARLAHLPALRQLGVDVVAAVDVDSAQLAAVADKWGINGRYPAVDPMLAAESPELVIICSPPSAHREQVAAALAAGAWVWCEKPPAVSLADYDAMTAGERDGGPYTAVVFQQRYGSGAIHAKRLLASGDVGRPLVAHCQTTWYRTDAYFEPPWRGTYDGDGGPVLALGIHQIDLLADLLGPWHEVMSYSATSARTIGTEDVNTAIARFDNGALATIATSVVSPHQESRIRIDAELATIEATYLYSHQNADWTITPAPDIDGDRAVKWENDRPDEPSGQLPQLRSLLADMRAGRRPATSGAGGRGAIELTTALHKSAHTCAPVKRGEITDGDPFYHRLDGGHLSDDNKEATV